MNAPLSSASDPGTPLAAPLPPEHVRGVSRETAVVLDSIHNAAGAGDVDETLRLSVRLASLRARAKYQAEHGTRVSAA